jgi:hypothetical protein
MEAVAYSAPKVIAIIREISTVYAVTEPMRPGITTEAAHSPIELAA